MRPLVPLLFCLPLSAAQSIQVAPRIPLAGDALLGLATGDQASPAMARGSNGYLVAWSDRRTTLASNSGSVESAQDIFAVRLDDSGAQVESTPFALHVSPGADTAPMVAWNGANWLVVWKSQAPLASQYSSALVGVRVSPQGAVLDATPVVILPYPFSEIGSTALASDGSNWVAVAQGTSGGASNVRAARVSAAGTLLDATPVELLPAGQLMNVELAYAQGSFLLVWSRYSGSSDDVVGRRFSSALAWQDAQPFAIGATPADDSAPQIGSNGAQFLVAWQGGAPLSTWSHVHAARVAPSGQVLDATPLTLATSIYYGTGPAAAPAFDGTHWFVTWTEYELRAARIAANGALLDAPGFVVDPTPSSTLVAPLLSPAPGGGVQLCWTDNRAGSYEGLDVYTARLLGPSGVGPQVGISSGASAQVTADLVRGSSNSLLVFRSETSGARRILASRLDALGQSLDAEPLVAATGLLAGRPAAGFDGSVYLVAWESGATSQILARRLSAAGAWLDPQPIVVGVGTSPEVAGKNGEFLVAYTRAVAYPLQQFPNYVRVRGADGALLGPAVALDSNYAVETDVCVVGDRWLLVWQRNYWNNDAHCDIHAAFVDSSGVATAPFWVAGAHNGYNHSPSVASSGDQALITWVYGTASNLTRRVHSRRIADDGAFLDASPLPLCPAVSAEQFNPSATWNGAEYLVAWQDLRASSSMVDFRSDLYVGRVTRQGALPDPSGHAVEDSSASECGPAGVGLGGGRTLLASTRFDPSPGVGAYRLGLRTLESGCAPPAVYCTAKPTSVGSLPAISHSGSTSLAAGDLRLHLAGGVPSVQAIHFWGLAPANAPFGGGWMCVTPPLARSALLTLDATGAALVAPSLAGALVGQTRFFQWWMRDPLNPVGAPTALSDALSVTFCP